jgi:hypothetical protein
LAGDKAADIGGDEFQPEFCPIANVLVAVNVAPPVLEPVIVFNIPHVSVQAPLGQERVGNVCPPPIVEEPRRIGCVAVPTRVNGVLKVYVVVGANESAHSGATSNAPNVAAPEMKVVIPRLMGANVTVLYVNAPNAMLYADPVIRTVPIITRLAELRVNVRFVMTVAFQIPAPATDTLPPTVIVPAPMNVRATVPVKEMSTAVSVKPPVLLQSHVPEVKVNTPFTTPLMARLSCCWVDPPAPFLVTAAKACPALVRFAVPEVLVNVKLLDVFVGVYVIPDDKRRPTPDALIVTVNAPCANVPTKLPVPP